MRGDGQSTKNRDDNAATTDDFVRYCCGDPNCPNDCEREQPPVPEFKATMEDHFAEEVRNLGR